VYVVVGVVAVVVPHAAPVQLPASDQVTAVLVNPFTVPVNVWVLLTSTFAVGGVIVIVTTVKLNVTL
jgi:hypothetical protein